MLLALALIATVSAKQSVPSFLFNTLTKGSSHTDKGNRIIDGEKVETNAAPYLVSLSVSELVYAHACAGVIIGKEWILTAAHCVSELKDMNGDIVGLPIYAGMRNRTLFEEAQITIIDFAFNHKGFTGEEGSDDIALLHVSPPLQLNGKVRPIALPYVNEEFTGEESAIYGWGLDDPEGTAYVKDLRVARSKILTTEQCKDDVTSEAPLSHKQVCVHVTACYGDGGSPLVVEREEGISELAGITSWGYLPCGYNARPTFFTAVSQYIEWINEVQWAYHVLH